MPRIICKEKPDIGKTFTIRTNLLSKVGSSFSLVFCGVVVGLARVIIDHSRNSRYHVTMSNGKTTNMAKNMYGLVVENIFGEGDE